MAKPVINLSRNDMGAFRLTLKTSASVVVDVSGVHDIFVAVKTDDDATAYVLEKSKNVGSGVTFATDGTNGVIDVAYGTAETATAYQDCIGSVEVEWAEGTERREDPDGRFILNIHKDVYTNA